MPSHVSHCAFSSLHILGSVHNNNTREKKVIEQRKITGSTSSFYDVILVKPQWLTLLSSENTERIVNFPFLDILLQIRL